MIEQQPQPRGISERQTLHPSAVRGLQQAEVILLILGLSATVVQHGLINVTSQLHVELGLVVISAMLILLISTVLQFKWSRIRASYISENRFRFASCGLWLLGVLGIVFFGPRLNTWYGIETTRLTALIAFSEILVLLRSLQAVIVFTRAATARGSNPAVVLVASFLILICVGTVLLMLPKARIAEVPGSEPTGAPFLTALFTATSASCVTGLIVEPTGEYWSRTGQTIILCLFQIGGLGILTFGAFFAVAAGRGMLMRESATLKEMFESERLGDVRQLILAILGVTLTCELIGAVCLSGLWAEYSFSDRAFYSLFHSVSAFCNAGFALQNDSLVAFKNRWQVWAVFPTLIIMGGLGFAVLYNYGMMLRSRYLVIQNTPLFGLPKDRARLSLTTRIILGMTFLLLFSGTLGVFVLESSAPPNELNLLEKLNNAWFQAVTFRTAGFNTVDLGQLQPATKLFAVLLMFIGASPGSTGGGVKTVCFSLTILALISLLKGRRHVEILGRKIPVDQVNRALTIMSLGIMMIMTSTILLVVFENRPDLFLDHLFESASAFGTVGVSTGVTAELTAPSRLVIIVTMFLGRVGPLTVLLAMAGRQPTARYEFPEERVTLG